MPPERRGVNTQSPARMLLDLYRSRGENPFVVHGNPTRRGWGWVLLAFGAAGFTVLFHAMPDPNAPVIPDAMAPS